MGTSKKPLKKNESLRKRVTFDLNRIKHDKQLVRAVFLHQVLHIPPTS